MSEELYYIDYPIPSLTRKGVNKTYFFTNLLSRKIISD